MRTTANEGYAEIFGAEFLPKVFYFCLRKTGSVTEAEELSSDIGLNVISALRKGVEPQNFSAWVWKIARNRYSVWAAEKHSRGEVQVSEDIGEFQVASGDLTPEETLVRREEQMLLRRELAYLSGEYREIVVSYYIEDRSVKKIAEGLGIPEGTVKNRLFRARSMIKEGMKMAREFGTMSYNPEEVTFTMNGSEGTNGEPFSLLTTKLHKNLLLAAYRMPSTAEALAVEMGVALPYTEEALAVLVDSTLMRKNGNKYETSFIILSKEGQEAIEEKARQLTSALFPLIGEILEVEEKLFAEAGARLHEGYQSAEDMHLTRYFLKVDALTSRCLEAFYRGEHPERPNRGRWDITGFEDGRDGIFIGRHGGEHLKKSDELDCGCFWQYKLPEIRFKTPEFLNREGKRAIVSIVKGQTELVSEDMLRFLVKAGYLRREGETYVPTFMISYASELEKCTALYETEQWQAAEERMSGYCRDCMEIIRGEISDFLRGDDHQIGQALSCCMFSFRSNILLEGLNHGWNKPGEDYWRGLGAYMIL